MIKIFNRIIQCIDNIVSEFNVRGKKERGRRLLKVILIPSGYDLSHPSEERKLGK